MQKNLKRLLALITSLAVIFSYNLAALEAFAGEEAAAPAEEMSVSSGMGPDDSAALDESVLAEKVLGESVLAAALAEAIEENPEAEEPTGYVPNEVIVVQENGEALIVKTEENVDEMALCEELEDAEGVAFAQPNYYYEMDASKTATKKKDTMIEEQWNLDYIDAQEAWNLIDQLRAKKSWKKSAHPRVKIATLDTGANTGHEDFADISKGGNLDLENCVSVKYTGKGESGEDQYEAVAYSISSGVHGTHTASVIAATSNNGKGVAGVAAGNKNDLVELMAIDVFPTFDKNKKSPAQGEATTADVVAGLDYAVNHGAQVVVMCLGHAPDSLDGHGGKHDDEWLHEKIKWAVNEKDVVICCSAGNKGNTDTWYPSDFEEVISCINTKKYDNIDAHTCKNSNSSYGPAKDISAPGTDIPMIDAGSDGYTESTGTSFAAPTVAAVAAMVRYVNPKLSQQEVKDILYKTTVDLYNKGYDEYTGWGNVNAYNAVSAAAGLNKRLTIPKLKMPVVKGESVNNDTIKLTWTNDPKARKYYVYRSTKSKSGFEYIAKVNDGSGVYVESGLTTGQTYYYKIKSAATTSDGKKTMSDESKVVAVSPTCGNIKISVVATGKKTAELSWTPSEGASGYKIYIKTSAKGKYKCALTVDLADDPEAKAAKISGLVSKKTYYYKARAYVVLDGKTYYGKYSNVVTRKQK